MKKSLLNSISKNSFLVDFYSSMGILAILGLLIFPFIGFIFLGFLCPILIALFYILSATAEKNLYANLKEAKNQLGLSIFTNDKDLLKKCLQVQKSLK
jgi:hypothetical protein